LRACDKTVAAAGFAHSRPAPAMNKNATTWRIDFFLDAEGELSYSPSHPKQVLITHLVFPLHCREEERVSGLGREEAGRHAPADLNPMDKKRRVS